MFGLIKKIFMGFLINTVNTSNHTTCVSLNNQRCMIQPTLNNLHHNGYFKEFHYYPFSVKWDRYFGSCIDILNPAACNCKNGKYLFICDKVIWLRNQNCSTES